MRNAALIAVVAIVAAALAGAYVNASAAPRAHAAPQATPIARKVAVLAAQVKTLQKQVKSLKSGLTDTQATVLLLNICSTELTTDAIQGTWTTIDQLAARSGAGYFGPQQAVRDPISSAIGRQLCSLLNVTRQNVQAQPSAAAIQTYLDFFSGGSRSAQARTFRQATAALQRGG